MTCTKPIEDSLEMLINTSGHFCWQSTCPHPRMYIHPTKEVDNDMRKTNRRQS